MVLLLHHFEIFCETPSLFCFFFSLYVCNVHLVFICEDVMMCCAFFFQ